MKKFLSFFAVMLIALTANAKVWNVSPDNNPESPRTDCNLYVTLERIAQAGDTILMADGEYIETLSTPVNAPVVIMAAEGAKPVVKMSGYFKVKASAKVEGIKFQFVGDAGNGYCFYFYENTSKSLVVEGCEFQDFTQYCISSWEDFHVDSIVVNNCYFHKLAKGPFYLKASSREDLSNTCDKLKVTNCTFNDIDINGYVAVIDLRNNDGGSWTGNANELLVDHCTFYNIHGDYNRIVMSYKSANAVVSNCIFAQPTNNEFYPTYNYGGSVLNNLSFNTKSHRSGPTQTANITGDPKFKDAANGDFTLMEGSPALTAGPENSPIGDPRWIPAAPFVPGEPEVIYLKPGEWAKDSAKFGVYAFVPETSEYFSDIMTLAEKETDVYTTTIPANYTYVVFMRLKKDATKVEWAQIWNQTKDLQRLEGKDMFTITTWGEGETPKADGEWSKYEYVEKPKFYVTGDTALVVAAGADKEQAWKPNAIKSMNDTLVLSLKADVDYVLKVTLNGTWDGENNVKGYNELSEKTPGLKDIGNDHNIGFKLNTAGEVKVIYAKAVPNDIFKLEGDFYVEPVLATCDSVYKLAKNDNVALAPVVVTYVNGKNIYVMDETAGLLVFLPANGSWKIGDKLTGIEGVVDLYNGIHEVKLNATQVAAVKVDSGAAPKPVKVDSITLKDMSKFILVEGIEFADTTKFAEGTASNINIVVGGDSIVLRNNFKNGYVFEPGKKYNISALVTLYNKKIQLYFVDANDATPAKPKYYLVGSMNEWKVDNLYEFLPNPGSEGEFMLAADLAVDDEFKVKGLVGDAETWYPEGMGNNYKVDAAHAGKAKKIYFRPDGQGGEGWHEGFFFVEENKPDPDKLKAVSDSTTWDFTKLAANTESPLYKNDGIQLADTTAPSKTDEIIYADYADSLWTIGEGFDGEAIAFTGEYPIRKNKLAQNGALRIKAAVAGSIIVKFSDTGTGAKADAIKRYLVINGDTTEYWASRERTGEDPYPAQLDVTTEAISIPKGDVIISGTSALVFYLVTFIPDATPEPKHTYTVAGSPSVFGSNWNPADTINDMKEVEKGIYLWAKNDIALAPGNIEFKICEDHAWTKAWPAQNYVIKIDSAGLYTVAIYFTTKDDSISAMAIKTGEAVVIPKVILHGDFTGSWADTKEFTLADDSLSASLKLNLGVKNYEFGMKFDGTWKANGAALTRENPSTSLLEGSGNMHINADVEGEYLFTYTFADEKLAVTYPEEQPGETIPSKAPAKPTAEEDDVLAIYCNHYTTNNLNFGISGWAGAYQVLDLEGTNVGYWTAMTWECIIDPAHTDDAHDLSGYKKLHVDLWAPKAAKIKFTVEAVAGGNYKDGVKVDLAAGWNSFDFVVAEWTGNYDFKNVKCFVFEQYQTPAEESFEGNPFAFTNIYLYDKESQAIDNTDATVKAVKVMENGQILIIKNGKTYNVLGTLVK